jgi:DNA-binding NtrC family response regulator
VVIRRYPQWRATRASTVLIVAEDAVARDVYGELFAMRGYSVLMAANAREGLTLARRRRIAVAVLALATGAAQLRRRLLTLRPSLKVHVTGIFPMIHDVLPAFARQNLH